MRSVTQSVECHMGGSHELAEVVVSRPSEPSLQEVTATSHPQWDLVCTDLVSQECCRDRNHRNVPLTLLIALGMLTCLFCPPCLAKSQDLLFP